MSKFYWKILSEKWFLNFGGIFYVASLNLGFWPPFCYCISDFHFILFILFIYFCFILILLGYFIIGAHFSAKIHSGKYFCELGCLWTPPPLTTNGSPQYLEHLSVKVSELHEWNIYSLFFVKIPLPKLKKKKKKSFRIDNRLPKYSISGKGEKSTAVRTISLYLFLFYFVLFFFLFVFCFICLYVYGFVCLFACLFLCLLVCLFLTQLPIRRQMHKYSLQQK